MLTEVSGIDEKPHAIVNQLSQKRGGVPGAIPLPTSCLCGQSFMDNLGDLQHELGVDVHV